MNINKCDFVLLFSYDWLVFTIFIQASNNNSPKNVYMPPLLMITYI